ncbi:hypothetical protein AX774_g4615 [Zancudomyces culisetae]|uniref:Globin-sensor domain-containing protein n=1 Tax=Zancudomyces culisetae TaxID=1213189 RepID=A0A1R1PHL2_ZANCU|nr:hypothetical protein AX774_g6136 [Zancudomyces culisetae]OMH81911.1 hypothetical protein AX774_g4615 [Zancudomyces culisetae]|eukprot:OMH80437.1 hypothetical protein AX774_g6136 [Zancudomyces culisetae]
MKHIDEKLLETDLVYRFGYVAEHIGFTEDDRKAILAVSSFLAPLAKPITDAVYSKLFQFDTTKKYFVVRHDGFSGKLADSLEELKVDDEIIRFRKNMLAKYVGKIINFEINKEFVMYIDWVGKIHTDTPDKKSKINVDYIHCNALLGYVNAALMEIINSAGPDSGLTEEQKFKACLAFTKLLWIQNDSFSRYYIDKAQPPAYKKLLTMAGGVLLASVAIKSVSLFFRK